MNRLSMASLFAISMALGGCVHGIRKPVTLAPPEIEQAYPTWQYIGIKLDPEAPCPKIGDWEKRQLFRKDPRSSPEELLPLEPEVPAVSAIPAASSRWVPIYPDDPKPLAVNDVIRELNRFCLYQTSRPMEMPRVVPELVRLEPDPVALTVAGEPSLESTLHHRFAAHFFDQVGRNGTNLPIHSGSTPVRLAFLDSHPTGQGIRELGPKCPVQSSHGDFLRLLGYAMTCNGQEGCLTDVRTRLALPIKSFDRQSLENTVRDTDCGGTVGSFDDLAEAIYAEVDEWVKEKKENPQSRLVINLSLGWDGERYGGLHCQMPAGPQTVYRALQYADVHGALVFAAAGNDKSGPSSAKGGPLLPAAWESGFPSQASCGELRTRPLVHAVGGLRSDGQPLSNARRRGSMPHLAAYGDHAALGIFGPKWPTSTYTGTSVSTAVVSSIAAAAWYRHPRLEPEKVVELLHERGENLDRLADFWFPASTDKPPSVSRISLCKALRPPRDNACCPAPASSRLVLSNLLDGGKDPIVGPKLNRDKGKCKVLSSRSPQGPELCASTHEDISSFPFIYPQPGRNPCPVCTDPPTNFNLTAASGSNRILYVEILKDWNDSTDGELQSATFSIEGGHEVLTSYFFDGPFRASARFEILLPGDEFDFASAPHATITWVVKFKGELYSILTPVFIAD